MVPPSAAAVGRLRAPRDIAAVLRGRRQRAGRLLVVYARARHEGPARIAVVASRRVGSAVAQNRAKRLLRAAAREVGWQPGTDVVLVARRAAASSAMPEVSSELAELATALGVASGAPA